jgi:heme/copper-type cytochrome/quinol oxidase subunit 2
MMDLYHGFLILSLISFFIFGILWICFARISMSYIEREMKKEGKEPPQWDGMGARAVSYAIVIALPAGVLKNYILVDAESAKRLSRLSDRKLAVWYLAAGFVGTVIILITYFVQPDGLIL